MSVEKWNCLYSCWQREEVLHFSTSHCLVTSRNKSKINISVQLLTERGGTALPQVGTNQHHCTAVDRRRRHCILAPHAALPQVGTNQHHCTAVDRQRRHCIWAPHAALPQVGTNQHQCTAVDRERRYCILAPHTALSQVGTNQKSTSLYSCWQREEVLHFSTSHCLVTSRNKSKINISVQLLTERGGTAF